MTTTINQPAFNVNRMGLVETNQMNHSLEDLIFNNGLVT